MLGAGTLLGRAFYLFDRGHRRLAVRNLQAAFPVRSRRRSAARSRAEMFAHFGRLLVVAAEVQHDAPGQMLARVEFEGEERVRPGARAAAAACCSSPATSASGRSTRSCTRLTLEPMAVLARPLDNPLLHDLLESVRTATGNSVIYRRGAIRRVLRALEANQAVAVLIDQHMQPADAVYVDFFNRPAATTSALAALALRTGAPVVPVFALPLPGGRFRMVYEHAVEPPRGDDEDAIREFTQRCTDVLEMYVRRYPELWLWMHRRWRDVPEGEQVRGMFPAATTDAPEAAPVEPDRTS